jgi:CRISPR-associated protein Cas2
MTNKQFWVIAYDIADDHRRQKVAKALEAYGTRSNFSVFECLVTEIQIKKIRKQLNKLINRKEDCILYYYLCVACVEKRSGIGLLPSSIPEVIVV